MTKLMDKKQVAEQLNISVKTLDNWVAKDRGPKSIRLGKLVRFREEDVELFVNELSGGAK